MREPARRWKREYHERRKTQAVTLSLLPEDVLALKLEAKANRRSMSAHVARLVSVKGDPTLAQYEENTLADTAELGAFLAAVPDEITALRNDLNRLGGLIKSLFIRPESLALAERHAPECARALAALIAAAEHTKPLLSRVEDAYAEASSEIGVVMKHLVRDR